MLLITLFFIHPVLYWNYSYYLTGDSGSVGGLLLIFPGRIRICHTSEGPGSGSSNIIITFTSFLNTCTAYIFQYL